MIQDCYTQPRELDARLERSDRPPVQPDELLGPAGEPQIERLDRRRDLRRRWACRDLAPDLLLHLHPASRLRSAAVRARTARSGQGAGYSARLSQRLETKRAPLGYDWIFVGDYAIEPVTRGAVFPNRALREAGLFRIARHPRHGATRIFSPAPPSRSSITRSRMSSAATQQPSASREAAAGRPAGRGEVLDREAQKERAASPIARSGDSCWSRSRARGLPIRGGAKSGGARLREHVDIHNKPGYDPCELFFGWPPGSVSFDTRNPRLHGRAGTGAEIAWSSSLDLHKPRRTCRARPRDAELDGRATMKKRTDQQARRSRWTFPSFSRTRVHAGQSRARGDARSARRKSAASRDGLHRLTSSRAASSQLGRADRGTTSQRIPPRTRTRCAAAIVPGGEAVKNDFARRKFMRRMLDLRLDRQSFVVIVGGGAVMDAVGLRRGARASRPARRCACRPPCSRRTDAGVGVKNGVNFLGGKNAIGTFAPPFAVLNDFDFLLTLPDRDWLCGVAEAFKVSIIRDRAFSTFSSPTRRSFARAISRRWSIWSSAAPRSTSSTSARTATPSNTAAPARSISATGRRTSSRRCPAFPSPTAKRSPPACCWTRVMPSTGRWSERL